MDAIKSRLSAAGLDLSKMANGSGSTDIEGYILKYSPSLLKGW